MVRPLGFSAGAWCWLHQCLARQLADHGPQAGALLPGQHPCRRQHVIVGSTRAEAGEDFSSQGFLNFVVLGHSSQPCEASAPDRGVSSDLQWHAHGIRRQSTTDLSLTILKQKLNRCLQILFGFLDGFTLSVSARDLQADRPEASLWSRLNHGGQLPLHETSPHRGLVVLAGKTLFSSQG
jgi:hypothetical protein